MRKLFYATGDSDENLNILNGVRTLALCYVILGHAYFAVMFMGIQANPDLESLNAITSPFWWGIVPGGFFAVDVFFFLSGFLAVYLMLVKLYSKRGKANYGLIYFHRFYRILPPVLMLMGLFQAFYIFLGSGPNWVTAVKNQMSNCSSYWWSNALFIENIYPWHFTDECIGWLWYLANDMQFFIISPIFVVLYCFSRKAGLVAATSMIFINGIIVMIITID